MNEFSILFLGTSEFSLEGLKTLSQSKNLKVNGVVTIPDRFRNRGLKKLSSPVKIWSNGQNLPLWTPESVHSQDFINEISKHKFDTAVIIAYGKILPKSFLDLFPKGVVNIHPSLLPRWRGSAPIERALLTGDKKTGVCLQIVHEKLDAGDIIKSYSFPIDDDDSSLEIYEKSKEASHKLLLNDFVDYLKGKIKPTPQTEEGLTYAKKIEKEEAHICWQKQAQEIHNQIRALKGGFQAFTFFQKKRIKIHRSKVLNQNFPSASPGEVVSCDGKLIVACKKGAVEILEIQKESHNKQSAKDFLTGQKINKGERFQDAL